MGLLLGVAAGGASTLVCLAGLVVMGANTAAASASTSAAATVAVTRAGAAPARGRGGRRWAPPVLFFEHQSGPLRRQDRRKRVPASPRCPAHRRQRIHELLSCDRQLVCSGVEIGRPSCTWECAVPS